MQKQSVVEFTHEFCEKRGAINKVDQEYYNNFLEFDDETMASIIKYTLISRITKHKKSGESSGWETEEDVYKTISSMLFLVAVGYYKLGEEEYQMYLYKPEGEMPDATTIRLINKKIEFARPFMEKALSDIDKEFSRKRHKKTKG